MIAVDTQILVYAHRPDSPWHPRAKECVAILANGPARWAIPLHCLVEFYALVTNPRLYRPPATSSPDDAIDQIDAWLESPTATVLADDAACWPLLRDLLGSARVIGAGAHDGRIAAVCLRHGVSELWTNDRDFLRFPALRVRNPLVEPPGHAAEVRAPYRARPHRRPASRPSAR